MLICKMCDASQILLVRFFISTIGLFSYIYRIYKITKVTTDPHISTHNLKRLQYFIEILNALNYLHI